MNQPLFALLALATGITGGLIADVGSSVDRRASPSLPSR